MSKYLSSQTRLHPAQHSRQHSKMAVEVSVEDLKPQEVSYHGHSPIRPQATDMSRLGSRVMVPT